jgi:hypothetical protein
MKNLEVNSDVDYIYRLDMLWTPNRLDGFPIEKGTIVENLMENDNGMYSFNVKGDSQEYTCSYRWAFVEKNKSNISILKKIDKEEIKLKKQKDKIKQLKNKLKQ